jgi:ABC-2 type transport system ATP-binding protein
MTADERSTEAATQRPAPVVELEGVSRWYGQVLGLNDVSVEIRPGITGLLGPNGAGKSTFLKLITGQIRPSAGRVRVLGESVWDNPRLMARIGYCPEIDHFYEHMTGVEFVTLMTRLQGFRPDEARRRALLALDRVRLADAAHRRVGKYSKGMRQKCKLAQALAHEPELLVLDEPLTGTDPVSRKVISDLLRALVADHGVSVVVSSHVLHEIEAMTREMLLIHHGRLLAQGGVEELRELIDEHPHRIRITCDRPKDLAAAVLPHLPVVSVHLERDSLEVETSDPAACYRLLPKLALEEGIRLRSLVSPDNTMEAVFRYLVGG